MPIRPNCAFSLVGTTSQLDKDALKIRANGAAESISFPLPWIRAAHIESYVLLIFVSNMNRGMNARRRGENLRDR